MQYARGFISLFFCVVFYRFGWDRCASHHHFLVFISRDNQNVKREHIGHVGKKRVGRLVCARWTSWIYSGDGEVWRYRDRPGLKLVFIPGWGCGSSRSGHAVGSLNLVDNVLVGNKDDRKRVHGEKMRLYEDKLCGYPKKEELTSTTLALHILHARFLILPSERTTAGANSMPNLDESPIVSGKISCRSIDRDYSHVMHGKDNSLRILAIPLH
jgi:hypothetical protein